MLKKLRRRFVIITMAIITAMLLIIFGMIIHFTNRDQAQKSDVLLQRLAKNALNPVNPEPDSPLPYFIINFSKGEGIVTGYNYNITDQSFLEQLMLDVDQDVKNNVHEGKRVNGYIGMLDEYGLKFTIVTTKSSLIYAFVDISSHQETMVALIQSIAIIGAISLAVFTCISILLAKWVVNPVDKAWKQQKQFISDASHELKTPLTVIMSNAELLQAGENEQETQQTVDNILTSSKQMRHLVDSMLELARADNGQMQTSFTQFDLSKTILDSILPFEPVFFESGLMLESNVEPDIQVLGSAQYLQQLTDILLDNAQKYSAPGTVDICLQRHGRNQCLLSVSNPGNPIPQEDLEAIFQRFYRVDTARTHSGSFGLGLAIAQRIAQEHGGQIWAQSNATGNRFNVLLPCYPAV